MTPLGSELRKEGSTVWQGLSWTDRVQLEWKGKQNAQNERREVERGVLRDSTLLLGVATNNSQKVSYIGPCVSPAIESWHTTTSQPEVEQAIRTQHPLKLL